MLFDGMEEDAPYVAVNYLPALRQQWPDLVISGMANRQLELEELRRMCKKRYCEATTVHSVEKLSGWICFDMWQIIIWNSSSSGGAQSHGEPNGRVHQRTVLIISGCFTRCQLQ